MRADELECIGCGIRARVLKKYGAILTAHDKRRRAYACGPCIVEHKDTSFMEALADAIEAQRRVR